MEAVFWTDLTNQQLFGSLWLPEATSFGWLIHTCSGSAGGFGSPRTKRCGFFSKASRSGLRSRIRRMTKLISPLPDCVLLSHYPLHRALRAQLLSLIEKCDITLSRSLVRESLLVKHLPHSLTNLSRRGF